MLTLQQLLSLNVFAFCLILLQELEEVSNKLIKEKINSVRHEKIQSPLGREQHIQELQQKLHMVTWASVKQGS